MPTVSVVVPTCDRPDLLRLAVESVRRQTYRDFELIVEDDTQTRRGGSATRNLGAARAAGRWLAFLDDDDTWHPDKLTRQMAVLANASPLVGFGFSATTNVRDDGERTTRVPAGQHNFLPRALERFDGFLTSSLVIRKEAFEFVGGFDPTFPSHQEPDLVIRLCTRYQGIA